MLGLHRPSLNLIQSN